MADLDKQHIRDLIAQGNRFEAMNIFLQSKFGKPCAIESSVKIKREAGEPSLKTKKGKESNQEKVSPANENSESNSESGSESGSDSESSTSSHTSSPAPGEMALVPEVELKEDENLDVDIETVDPLSEGLLPRPHMLDHGVAPPHMGQPQHNMQGYNQMSGMGHYGAPPGGTYGPYCVQVPQYGPRADGTHTGSVWLDPSTQQPHPLHPHHPQQQQQNPQHLQQQQHLLHHPTQQQQQENADFTPRVQREKQPVPNDLHKKTHQKFFRDQGRPYISRATGKEIRGRAMGPPCNCKKKCWSKIEHGAEEIFSAFWDMGNFDEQNVYLYGNISIKPVSRHYVKGSNRRTYTFTYWCKIRGKHVEVCKEMFMGVHGLQNSRGRIGNLMKQMKDGNLLPKPDQRGKHANRPNKYTEQSLQGARQHIEMYINRNMTLKKMYRDFYVPWCEEHKLVPVSEDKYRRIYSEEYKVS